MAHRKGNRIRIIGMNPSRFERGQIKFLAYLVPFAIIMMLPIVFIVSNAFKPLDELFIYPPKMITTRPTLENFQNLTATSVNQAIPASRYLFNSLVSTLAVVILTVLITVCAAYCMSKKKYRLKKMLFELNTLSLMFVPVAVGIPRYFIVEQLGLVDSFLSGIIPALAMPIGLFLVKQFIDQLPNELLEASAIDGASDYFIVFRIVMPNILPALSTVAMLTFQSSWNSTDASVYYINNEALKNFAYYLTTLTATAGNSNDLVSMLTGAGNVVSAVAGMGLAAAGTLLMFIPNVVLFIVLQSRVMNTMSHSGMK
ncbi:MAG: carbohydrate ABC transporter permease [Oscillospiraceae bacterium]|jgi:ABC-type glycerol-3-phosphate transport system permease component|nr:carbohydrate ABC transporter permease [Oscillospiraceae bacterium]